MNSYLSSVRKQFEYYESLGDKTFRQLSDEELFWQANEYTNSIAVIVGHLWGNMLSRWTDFRTTDGEKEWRNRDREFEQTIQSREELLSKWQEGWQCLYRALDTVGDHELEELVYIRNQGHSIIEAVNRQLCHYSYHVGQIVAIGTQLRGGEWQSLSIAKGASKVYNKAKFSQEKSKGHFTDEYLEK